MVTTFDGYQMALQGRAGAALGISAIGSFIGGILGTFGLIFVAVPLAQFSLKFGPAEYFSLIIMGMLTIVFVGGKSITKSLMSGVIGISLGVVGSDIVQGAPRFVFGIPELMDGIDFVVVVMGLFGIGEVLVSAEEFMKMDSIKVPFTKLWPTDEGHGGLEMGHGPRDGDRLRHRRPAGGGGDDRLLPFLWRGKRRCQGSGTFRERGDRGGCRTRDGQQRRLLRRHGPPAGPGHSGIRERRR